MSESTPQTPQLTADPLIDEIRAIRAAIIAECGGDMDRLVEHLREVEREFASRTGRFANVPRTSPADPFPDKSTPVVDESAKEFRSLKTPPDAKI